MLFNCHSPTRYRSCTQNLPPWQGLREPWRQGRRAGRDSQRYVGDPRPGMPKVSTRQKECQLAKKSRCSVGPQTLNSFIQIDQKGGNDMHADGADFTTEHNLRTSVTIIRAASEILCDHPDMPPGQRQRFQDTLVSESARLSGLIDQLVTQYSPRSKGSGQGS